MMFAANIGMPDELDNLKDELFKDSGIKLYF